MKINLQKMIIGAILISSAMSAFGAAKFNSKKAISVLSREDGSGDNYAIGYVSLGSLNDSVKAVKIIAANKYIKIQNTKAYTSNKTSGKVVVAGSSSVSPVNGIPAMYKIGLTDFLFGTKWKPGTDLYGIFPMIVGSLYVTAGAIITGVPVGLMTAVFLSRFCPKWLHKILKPAIGETMAVIMVAGNQARIPDSILKGVRTLTANIVIEMGYATDLHREALIATGVVLFVFILLINLSFNLVQKR